MELSSYLVPLSIIIITIVFYIAYISKVEKRADEEKQIRIEIKEELQKHTDLLEKQNNLLEKILSETSDEEKAELTEKLKQVSNILNGN